MSMIHIYQQNRSPSDFPPGPWTLPIIRDTYRVDPNKMHLNFEEFAGKYGPIFSIQILGVRVVVVNGYKLMREVLVKRGEDYTDRPIIPIIYDVNETKGLLLSSGNSWKQQRRFALYTLRNFGLGKTRLEPTIQQECQYLIESFAQQQGAPSNPRTALIKAISNIISCLLFGKRFEYTDKKHQSIVEDFHELVKLQGGRGAMLYNTFPWLVKHFPGPHRGVFTLTRRVLSYIEERVEEHRVDHDPSLPRDYIDCFLTEMLKNEAPESRFDIENLSVCTLDLFVAGTETTTTTLHWGLLFMTYYPDIQKKVHAELDTVVGSSRQPSMSDRDSTPYTYAVIQETQRMGNILPLNIARMTTRETHIGKYTLPKGTVVMATLNSVLRDETMWETPHSFNPQHFLDQDGQARNREAFLPFSAGKRVCPGEQLARMELYLFFTSLLQRFSFSSPPGEKLSLDSAFAFINCPQPFRLCATPR
ncbi:cytochrome P450 2J2 isoform X2 [Gadus morhua]|uniref:cytochrome P450 2J2 isoform X2 n=1 Tax=Gadus morhua TaxID=8049 RepID=UPI0011B5418C|nr:cytochrome P450 2J2-like isoform X2 [Gadus morhua]